MTTCRIIEGSTKKCELYWPLVEDDENFQKLLDLPGMTVDLTSEEKVKKNI